MSEGPPPAEDGLYGGIPESVYHGDRDSLSSSGARLLLPPSCPAIFKARQEKPERKAEFDFGHAAHKYVLSVGEQIVAVEANNWRTKAAQELRQKAYDEGRVPILLHESYAAKGMARRVRENPLASSLLSDGDPELSGYWHDPETGVRLRCRPDWLPEIRSDRRLIVVDYKTTVGNADPEGFARSAATFGYHIQAAMYLDGVAATTGVDDAAFVFIVQSKRHPYVVSVIELDSEAIALGRRQLRRAIDTYAACIANDYWPEYGNQVHRVSLPTYAAYQAEEYLSS